MSHPLPHKWSGESNREPTPDEEGGRKGGEQAPPGEAPAPRCSGGVLDRSRAPGGKERTTMQSEIKPARAGTLELAALLLHMGPHSDTWLLPWVHSHSKRHFLFPIWHSPFTVAKHLECGGSNLPHDICS